MLNLAKEKLIMEMARYYVSKQCTIRDVARVYNVPKSTVYMYFRQFIRGPHSTKEKRCLAIDVAILLIKNRSEAPLRGGEAVKQKYLRDSDPGLKE